MFVRFFLSVLATVIKNPSWDGCSQPSDADFPFKCTWWQTKGNKLLGGGTCKRFDSWPFKALSLASRSCNRRLSQLLHILYSSWNCRTLTLIITSQEFMGWMMHLQQSILFPQASFRGFKSKSKTNLKHPKSLVSFGDPGFWDCLLTTWAGKLQGRTAQVKNGRSNLI